MSKTAARVAAPRLRHTTREGAVAAAPRRAPRVQPPATARPKLRVVDPEVLRRQRRFRRFVGLIGLVTVAALLVAVGFHVKLAESQFQLDRLNQQTAKEQRRYQELRLQVAELAAPDRIVETAKDKLGMVQPERVTYLSAAPTEVARADDRGDSTGADVNDSTASTLAESWPKVKGNLAARP